MDFRENREATVELLRRCRHEVFERRRPVTLDFSSSISISPPASLVLLAEVYRCRTAAGHQSLTGNYPPDQRVAEQLKECGFFEALQLKNPPTLRSAADSSSATWIKFRTGTGADGALVEQFKAAVFAGLPGDLASRIAGAEQGFYRGLVEAMTNTSQHADPDRPDGTRVRRLPRQWWLLGHVDRKNQTKSVRIMIFDQGIGIPRSLREKHRHELIQGFLEGFGLSKDDGEMIRAAMEIGKSRTRRVGRGKGLHDLKRVIDVCQGGYLRILSSKGELTYSAGSGYKCRSNASSIGGTYIEWVVPLDRLIAMSKREA